MGNCRSGEARDEKNLQRASAIEAKLHAADQEAERRREHEQQERETVAAAIQEAARQASAQAVIEELAYQARMAAAIDPVYIEHRRAHPGPLYGTRAVPVPLAEAAHLSDPEGLVPLPVRATCNWLLHTPGILEREGLFRIPGSSRRCKELIEMFNTDPDMAIPAGENPNNVCSLLVKYIMALGGASVVTATCEDTQSFITNMVKIGRDYGRDPVPPLKVREMVESLPAPNRATLKYISHLLHVASQDEWSQTNKMSPTKFAMCVIPIMQAIFSVMIEHYSLVFEKATRIGDGRIPHSDAMDHTMQVYDV